MHQHLDYVDRTLDSLSREIQAEVNDIIDTTDVTVEYDIVELDDRRSDRERARATKDVISGLENSYDDGAPEKEVIALLEYSGLSRAKAEHEIERLKQKGEIYEPSMEVVCEIRLKGSTGGP